MNYYDVLGVPQSASPAEIRAAYLAQIKYFHPDVFPGNPEIAKLKTLQLNEAYAVLYNPDRRAQYDWILNREAEAKKPPPPPPPPPPQTNTSAGTNSSNYHSRSRYRSKSEKTLRSLLGIAGVLVLSCFMAVFFAEDTPESSMSIDSPTASQVGQNADADVSPTGGKPDSLPRSLPENGEIIFEKGWDRIAPFTVVTTSDNNFFVKLKTLSGTETILSFFVRAGETVDIDVPLGTFTLYYATGETWYGPGLAFGNETHYYRADDTFEFYEEDGYVNGWTVELYLQSNGNLYTESISADEF